MSRKEIVCKENVNEALGQTHIIFCKAVIASEMYQWKLEVECHIYNLKIIN